MSYLREESQAYLISIGFVVPFHPKQQRLFEEIGS